MINTDEPIEFEDGTPVEWASLRHLRHTTEKAYVSIPKGIAYCFNKTSLSDMTCWYSPKTGEIGGFRSNLDYKKIRNVQARTEVEDWS